MTQRYYLITYTDGMESILRTKFYGDKVFMEEKSKLTKDWFHWDRLEKDFLKSNHVKYVPITKEVADIIISHYEMEE